MTRSATYGHNRRNNYGKSILLVLVNLNYSNYILTRQLQSGILRHLTASQYWSSNDFSKSKSKIFSEGFSCWSFPNYQIIRVPAEYILDLVAV